MELNKTPMYDDSDNPTGCCPRFDPDPWDDQELHFKNKLFVKATTRSLFHIPINMGRVFQKTFDAIEEADAIDISQFLVLTRDLSPWKSEHYFAVTKGVPGLKVVQMSGDFVSKVFEGPFKEAPNWYHNMEELLDQRGKKADEIYFFYTTCPNCAKFYGKNYAVGFGKAA